MGLSCYRYQIGPSTSI